MAQGYGRNFYSDYRIVEVLPVDPDLGEGQDGVQDSFPPTMDMVLTAWMYDDGGGRSLPLPTSSSPQRTSFSEQPSSVGLTGFELRPLDPQLKFWCRTCVWMTGSRRSTRFVNTDEHPHTPASSGLMYGRLRPRPCHSERCTKSQN